MKSQRFAIIDIGSNSVRLVINAISKNGCYKELYNFKTVARLSAHIDTTGRLTEEGIFVITETLQRFKKVILYHRVQEVLAVATAAIRKASNQKDVIEHVYREIGFNIRVLSEYEEAYYGYLAVINSTTLEHGITIDIGGGSTEITLFEDRELKHFHSFPFGAITLQNEFIEGEQPTNTELDNLKQYILTQFSTLPWLKMDYTYPVVGIGGSARNLSLIHQRKIDYPLAGLHQYEIPTEQLQLVNDELQKLTLEQRQNVDGLSKDRADIIIPASQVITSLLNFVGTNTFILSRKGLRDGLFYESVLKPMETDRFPNVIEESFYQLSHNYDVQLADVNHLSLLASQLYSELKSACRVEHSEEEALHLLKSSARVLYIGEYINNEASSQTTFYLLTNMTIEGLTHQERLAIALISSFKSKKQLNQYAGPFKRILKKKQLKLYEFLGAIMKFAYCLDYTRRKAVTEIGKVEQTEEQWVIPLSFQEEYHFEAMQVNKHKKHLERAIRHPIEVTYQSNATFTT
ncbi:exopolyphosphatase [Halalkalibacter urbisdiaboli]|uniref:exopolyphosphatase n=1 Tax=Halalkalibacter urbisdiaboli TaxID=1960589 RepID=UPI000B437BEA|nr:exopolyphosphatase [Halalkalibacter urbisdiaboli]